MSLDNDEFPPLDHSVYLGRKRLGRYFRAGRRLYAAYDDDDEHLGNFKTRRAAYQAVTSAAAWLTRAASGRSRTAPPEKQTRSVREQVLGGAATVQPKSASSNRGGD